MREVSWTEIKRETLTALKEGECIRVTGDGSVGVFLIPKPEGYMVAQIEGICSQIDASRIVVPPTQPATIEEMEANLEAGIMADPEGARAAIDDMKRRRASLEQTGASLKEGVI
jgi:hypothetical protein